MMKQFVKDWFWLIVILVAMLGASTLTWFYTYKYFNQKTEIEIRYDEQLMENKIAKERMVSENLYNDYFITRAQKRVEEAQLLSNAADIRGKAIIAEATAQAQANRILQDTLTDEVLEYTKLKAWDGKLPSVIKAEAESVDKEVR